MTSAPEGEKERGQGPKEEDGPTVTWAPEEEMESEMESGLELKEEGGPFPSLDPSDQQKDSDEPSSQTSCNGGKVSAGPQQLGLLVLLWLLQLLTMVPWSPRCPLRDIITALPQNCPPSPA